MSDLDDGYIPEDDEDIDPDFDIETLETRRETVELSREPLFSRLLKQAVHKTDPNDTILQEFINQVVPNISLYLADKTAKGGEFVQALREAGVDEAKFARYRDDQSMRAHLVNGLLPVARIAKKLRDWHVPNVVERFDETAYRLFLAGFTLHDWLKLPYIDDMLATHGLKHATVNVVKHLPLIEDIFREWCIKLGIDTFLQPIDSLDNLLHHLILIASNTQVRWGVMPNLAQLKLLHPRYRQATVFATALSTLADYLAYLGRTPVEAVDHEAIRRSIALLSNYEARLTYHHLAEVRGVVTNLIHNTVLTLRESDDCIALLYAPTGVVYLERIAGQTPVLTAEVVAQHTVEHIQTLCGEALRTNLNGFARDGKGLKYAPFYDLFFTPRQLAEIAAQGAYRRTLNKASAAETRFSKMATVAMIPAGATLPRARDNAVDMLAEGLALLEKILNQHAPTFAAQMWLLEQIGVGDLNDHVTQIPQLANTGGVPYQWYYAAGTAVDRRTGRDHDAWHMELVDVAANAAQYLGDSVVGAGWNELRQYVLANLRFGQQPADEPTLRTTLERELANYSGARRSRQATSVCSLCSSSYSISQQREAAILFAPMVYSNKQALHGSKAMRNICAICEIEMMLRQLLMNRSNAAGKKFEGRRLRYLFFYPTYFFTPETLEMINDAALQIKNFSVTALREALLPKDEMPTNESIAHVLDPQRLQRLDTVFFDGTLKQQPQNDRWLRMHFGDGNQPMFTFIGVPPASRDAKDAEAWVKPTMLALLLPLLLDVKVVASESMLPLINEATELPETVLLDSPHAFIPYLLKRSLFNYDEMVKSLQALIAAYMIHLDGNSKTGGGFDYVWNRLPTLARDLDTSPLYVFAYLKRWQRRNDRDNISPTKAKLYLRWFEYITMQPYEGGTSMGERVLGLHHAEKLVTLYRQFYRHPKGKRNSNTILKPISIAAAAMLDADSRLFSSDSALVTVVRGRLQRFIDDVEEGRGAEGNVPRWIGKDERQIAMKQFAEYWVESIYRGAFDGDLAAFRGKQLNLLKGACEVLYLDAQAADWEARQQDDESTDEV